MKRNIAITILFLSSISLFAQMEVHKLNMVAYDLVYDSFTDKIYVSLLSANGFNGNSLGVVNPHTAELEETIFMGSEPTVLAISDDGKYIYSGFGGSSSVRRFKVADRQADIQFSLGYGFLSGPFFAEDIKVMPGQNTTIAVSRYDRDNNHGGVAIFDHGIMRQVTTFSDINNVIEFRDSASLIGFNFTTTEFGLHYLRVDQFGVTEMNVAGNVLSSRARDFVYHDNRIYATDGTVAFVAGFPFAIGRFSGARGPVVYDKNSNFVCYANLKSEDKIELARYYPDDFRLLDKYPVPGATGFPYNITTCGDGCYAFNTTDNQLFIIRPPALSTYEHTLENSITLYPNPVTDFLKISSGIKTINVQITDLSGRIVGRYSTGDDIIDFRSFASGTYFIRITGHDGHVYNQKVIRK